MTGVQTCALPISGTVFNRLVKKILSRGRSRYDRQLQAHRVLVQNLNLCEVDRLELYFVDTPVRSSGRDLHLFRKHSMLDNRSAVRTQDNFFFQFRLFLLLRFFSRSPGIVKLLVDLLQIFVFVVER